MTQTNYKTARKRNQISLDFLRSLDNPDTKYVTILKSPSGYIHILGIFSSEEAAIKRGIDYINERFATGITEYSRKNLSAMKKYGVRISVTGCIADSECTDIIV